MNLSQYIESRWLLVAPVLQIGYKRFYAQARKLWSPIFIDEGEIVPWYYGISHWIPYPYHNPPLNPRTFKWRKIAYPYHILLPIAFWHWINYKLRRGFAIPPECYRSQVFQIKEICPHCDKNVYEHPVPPRI